MMKLVLAAFAVLATTIGFAAPVAGQQAPRILCESVNGETRMCPVQGLTEAFVVQTLGGQCIAGRQWGWGARGITVNSGCRAVFGYRTAYAQGPAPGYVAPPQPPRPGFGGAVQTVNCSSMNFQYTRCPMDTRNGVTIGMVTNQPCRQGQTWGWDRSGVWVSGNCRAYFKSVSGGYGNGGNAGGGYPGGGIGNGAGVGNGYPNPGNPGIGNGASVGSQVIECNSWQFQPARCPARTRNGVALVQVLGGTCNRNRTWGWDENGIWVNGGCRARFRLN